MKYFAQENKKKSADICDNREIDWQTTNSRILNADIAKITFVKAHSSLVGQSKFCVQVLDTDNAEYKLQKANTQRGLQLSKKIKKEYTLCLKKTSHL